MAKDHLGKAYETIEAMCASYGVKPGTYFTRRRRGFSLQEALQGRSVEDHLGNRYKSKTAMCAHYGLTLELYKCRMKYGWTLKKALTKKVRKRETPRSPGGKTE